MSMVVTNGAGLDAAVLPLTALEIKNPAMASTIAARKIAARRARTSVKLSFCIDPVTWLAKAATMNLCGVF